MLPIGDMSTDVVDAAKRVDTQVEPYSETDQTDQVMLGDYLGIDLRGKPSKEVKVLINLVLAVGTLVHRVDRLERYIAKLEEEKNPELKGIFG